MYCSTDYSSVYCIECTFTPYMLSPNCTTRETENVNCRELPQIRHKWQVFAYGPSLNVSINQVPQLKSAPWGPPRVKVRGGGKGSWTERQIGMLPVVTLLCINKVKCH